MRFITSVSFPALLALATVSADDKVTLRVNLAKDDLIRYHTTMNQVHSVILPEELAKDAPSGDSTSDTQQDFEYRVSERNADGSMVIESKIERLRGKMKVPMQENAIEFDSTQPSDNPLVTSLTMLAGKSVKLVLDPTGTITEIRGVSDILAAVQMPSDASGEVTGLMRQAFSDESMKKAFGKMFSVLPATPVGVGDTWTNTSDLDAGGLALTTKLTYKVSAIDADGVDVAIEGTMAAKPQESKDGSKNKMSEALGKMALESGVITGHGRFSRRDGLPIHQTMTSSVLMSMPIPNSDQPVKMKQAITSTSERVAAAKDQ